MAAQKKTKKSKLDEEKTKKSKLDEARFKPIKDTRSLKQKFETKVFGGFEGQATVGYKEGRVVSTNPAKNVRVGLGQTVYKAKETMVTDKKKKKKK